MYQGVSYSHSNMNTFPESGFVTRYEKADVKALEAFADASWEIRHSTSG